MGNIGTVGRHFIVEMWGCDNEMINDPEKVMDILHNAAKDARATVIKSASHQFDPSGVTGIAILAESHISIHTWPEEGYVAADIFTCGTNTDPELGVQSLIDGFKPENSSTMELKRGNAQSKEPVLIS
ncbi:MAG: adenosylmethionine decarboxylase [Candidatus Anammoxibacter sp.]